MEAAAWIFGAGQYYCTHCRLAARQKKKVLDCEKCPKRRPEATPGTQRLLDCFTLCASQTVFADGVPAALNWEVVIRVAESLGIPLTPRFYRLLQAFESTMVAEYAKKRKSAGKAG